ncbi:hypothetical protein QTP86_018248 [Hemibagrus guttatus]|nr:hypothetical protein QTP86_018248 [Hemibagrus guttatus]
MERTDAERCAGENKKSKQLEVALIKVEGIMNNSRYQSILAQNRKASAKRLKMKNFTFQHDNDLKHTHKPAK